MIKINLASQRSAGGGGQVFGGQSFQLANLNLDLLKDLPIRKLIVPVVLWIFVYQSVESYKRDEVKKFVDGAGKLNSEGKKLQEEINKFKDYSSIKKGFEQDELTIRSKLDTIKKLLNNRDAPSRLLLAIASSIPKEVWLTDVKLDGPSVIFKGSAMGYSQVSDFMKSLAENAYLFEVEYKGSQQADKDSSGLEVASFEITAKRRQFNESR